MLFEFMICDFWFLMNLVNFCIPLLMKSPATSFPSWLLLMFSLPTRQLLFWTSCLCSSYPWFRPAWWIILTLPWFLLNWFKPKEAVDFIIWCWFETMSFYFFLIDYCLSWLRDNWYSPVWSNLSLWCPCPFESYDFYNWILCPWIC